MKNWKQYLSLIVVLGLWISLVGYAWVKPADGSSDSERRPLAQFPEVSADTIFSGKFMTGFADYAGDQFPLRDSFRTLNALLTYYGLGQKDNNGIYLHDGYAAKMEYPMNESAVGYASARFQDLYKKYLARCRNIYFAVVPDKSYYLADDAGVLRMDYEAMFAALEENLPWAKFVDLTGSLNIDSYFRTDTHWRQELLLPVVQELGEAMKFPVPEDFDFVTAKEDFYGVYFGQAALPMDPEPLNWVTWEGWEDIRVQIMDTNTVTGLYNEEKLSSRDPYESYLSGNVAVEVITNPNAETNRELVVFRDSFGSSVAPWLARSYAKITLVDTRYVAPVMISQFVTFNPNTEVLFLYSTLVINSSSSLRQ